MEQQGSALGSFLPLILLFAIFYFLIIRPQQKHQKAHKAMLEGLEKGDDIITTGGLIAVIVKTKEDFINAKKRGLIPDNIPASPWLVYSKKRKK